MRTTLLLALTLITLCACNTTKDLVKTDAGFKPLFNGENFDGWYLKLRNGDQELAKKVYAIEDGMVHVFNDEFPDKYELNTGENGTHGLFYTKKEYSKYVLRFEYKWGEKIANNFDRWQYDAGVYYHVTDDKIWPLGIEYQVRYDHTTGRNHTGDLIRPKGTSYEWYSDEETKAYLSKDKGGTRKNDKGWMHLSADTDNFHGADGQWNQCEIVVMGGDYVVHKLNGEVVNVGYNLSPSKGILGFQSETAEIFYKNIQIKEFTESRPIEEFIK